MFDFHNVSMLVTTVKCVIMLNKSKHLVCLLGAGIHRVHLIIGAVKSSLSIPTRVFLSISASLCYHSLLSINDLLFITVKLVIYIKQSLLFF